eukprot:1142481-Pelagomonas_calceolata.AAC.3
MKSNGLQLAVSSALIYKSPGGQEMTMTDRNDRVRPEIHKMKERSTAKVTGNQTYNDFSGKPELFAPESCRVC